MKKAILGMALVAPMIAGCLDEGRIDFKKDKIEVTITDDKSGNMNTWAGWFFHVERNAEGRSDYGMGRPVVFNTEGLIPSACIAQNNCTRQAIDSVSPAGPHEIYMNRPENRDYLGQPLRFVSYQRYGIDVWIEPNGNEDINKRLNWVKLMLSRVDMQLLGFEENRFMNATHLSGSILPSSPTRSDLATRAMTYVMMRLEGTDVGCPIEEWLNEGQGVADECDGSDFDFAGLADWGRWSN